MYIALSVQFGRDDQLIFTQQLGVEHVIAQVESWDEKTLHSLKNRVEKTGLQLAGLEGLSTTDNTTDAIRAAGAAGIGLVSYNSLAPGPRSPDGRGEALMNSSTGDAPLDDLGGITQIASTVGVALAAGRAQAAPGVGLDLDLSTLGDDPAAALAALESPILIVRANNNLGSTQAFLDEGDSDLPQILLALKRTGFSGPLCAVTPPGLSGDSDWGHKGRAFDLGYLKAVLQTIDAQ